MSWVAFDEGKTLGELGSEDGIILKDEELLDSARITIEQGGRIAPFSITCGLYGWTAHTRFFGTQREAEAAMEEMKEQLARLVENTWRREGEDSEATMQRMGTLIPQFVERFP